MTELLLMHPFLCFLIVLVGSPGLGCALGLFVARIMSDCGWGSDEAEGYGFSAGLVAGAGTFLLLAVLFSHAHLTYARAGENPFWVLEAKSDD